MIELKGNLRSFIYKIGAIPCHHEVNHTIKEASRRHPYQMHYVQLMMGNKYNNQGKESSGAFTVQWICQKMNKQINIIYTISTK